MKRPSQLEIARVVRHGELNLLKSRATNLLKAPFGILIFPPCAMSTTAKFRAFVAVGADNKLKVDDPVTVVPGIETDREAQGARR